MTLHYCRCCHSMHSCASEKTVISRCVKSLLLEMLCVNWFSECFILLSFLLRVIILAGWCIFVDLCHARCVQLAYLYASCSELFTSPSGVRRQLLSATPAHNAVPFICQSWYASGENVNPPAPSAKQTSAHTRLQKALNIIGGGELCDKKQGLTWNKIDFSKKQYRLLKIAIWDVWKEEGGKLERESERKTGSQLYNMVWNTLSFIKFNQESIFVFLPHAPSWMRATISPIRSGYRDGMLIRACLWGALPRTAVQIEFFTGGEVSFSSGSYHCRPLPLIGSQ